MVEKKRSQWITYGLEAKRLRTNLGLTQSVVAKQLHISGALLSGFERGTRVPKRQIAEALDAMLNAGGALVRLWVELSNVEAYPSWVADLVEAEPVATVIRDYQTVLIPGLLQTEDYARATTRAGNPMMRNGEIERLVEARMKRQTVLNSANPPGMWCVLDYPAIARPVGGPKVMGAQLERLSEHIEERRMHLQIILMEHTEHPGLTGPFKILSFKDKPDVVYTESRLHGMMFPETDHVAQMSLVYGSLQSAGISEAETLDMLHKLRRDFNGT